MIVKTFGIWFRRRGRANSFSGRVLEEAMSRGEEMSRAIGTSERTSRPSPNCHFIFVPPRFSSASAHHQPQSPTVVIDSIVPLFFQHRALKGAEHQTVLHHLRHNVDQSSVRYAFARHFPI
jgi:hypothetical protein